MGFINEHPEACDSASAQVPPSPESFRTDLGGGVKAFGTPEFWEIVKGAKLRRRKKDFAGAIAEFERAVALAKSYQCSAVECQVEIARTLWHDEQTVSAIEMANAFLPDMSAVKLLASIWREQGKESLKKAENPNALMCFTCVEELEKLNGFTLLTPKDRETLAKLRRR